MLYFAFLVPRFLGPKTLIHLITEHVQFITEQIPQGNVLSNLKYPSVLNSWFKFSSDSHSCYTRWASVGYSEIPSYQNENYCIIQ